MGLIQKTVATLLQARRPPASVQQLQTTTAPGAAQPVFFTVFYSFVRLQIVLRPQHDAANPEPKSVVIIQNGRRVEPRASWQRVDAAWEVTLEAMIDRDGFPDNCALVASAGADTWQVAFIDIVNDSIRRAGGSLFATFKDLIAGITPPDRRLRMLDIGGRARSGNSHRQYFPECDYTTFDIIPDPTVDVVGDAHTLSQHFPAEHFDCLHCVSVFEHLLMPWKVAVEMNRILKPGGYIYVHTHQTLGLHDVPWDFLRFSEYSWPGFFNRYTGFEITNTLAAHYHHLIPRDWWQRYEGAEGSGGFETSTVIARKTGPATVEWDIPLRAIVETMYPRD